jgi:hypothetical protein
LLLLKDISVSLLPLFIYYSPVPLANVALLFPLAAVLIAVADAPDELEDALEVSTPVGAR